MLAGAMAMSARCACAVMRSAPTIDFAAFTLFSLMADASAFRFFFDISFYVAAAGCHYYAIDITPFRFRHYAIIDTPMILHAFASFRHYAITPLFRWLIIFAISLLRWLIFAPLLMPVFAMLTCH
jgi:hypothetical protein